VAVAGLKVIKASYTVLELYFFYY